MKILIYQLNLLRFFSVWCIFFIYHTEKETTMNLIRLFLPILCYGIIQTATAKQSDDCAYLFMGKCHSCNTPVSITVGSEKECTDICPNRVINYYGSGTGINYNINCVLPACPDSHPLTDNYGGCYACDDDNAEPFFKNCSACPNRYEKQGRCRFKDERPLKYESIKTVPPQKCPIDKPLQEWTNTCFSCDTPHPIQISSSFYDDQKTLLESVCPNRTIIADAGGNPTSILNCPAERPLMDANGNCHPCNTELVVDTRYNPDFCHRFCPKQRHANSNGTACLKN